MDRLSPLDALFVDAEDEDPRGTVTFGITGDFAVNPDLDVLARGIERDLSELLAAAKRHHRRAAARRRSSAAL